MPAPSVETKSPAVSPSAGPESITILSASPSATATANPTAARRASQPAMPPAPVWLHNPYTPAKLPWSPAERARRAVLYLRRLQWGENAPSSTAPTPTAASRKLQASAQAQAAQAAADDAIGPEAAMARDVQRLRELKPTFELMVKLRANHLTLVPFENLTLHRGLPYSVEVEELFDKIVTRKMGGICFEVNVLLGWLLTELGFGVRFSVQQFNRSAATDGFALWTPYTHMALFVTVPPPGTAGPHSIAPADAAAGDKKSSPSAAAPTGSPTASAGAGAPTGPTLVGGEGYEFEVQAPGSSMWCVDVGMGRNVGRPIEFVLNKVQGSFTDGNTYLVTRSDKSPFFFPHNSEVKLSTAGPSHAALHGPPQSPRLDASQHPGSQPGPGTSDVKWSSPRLDARLEARGSAASTSMLARTSSSGMAGSGHGTLTRPVEARRSSANASMIASGLSHESTPVTSAASSPSHSALSAGLNAIPALPPMPPARSKPAHQPPAGFDLALDLSQIGSGTPNASPRHGALPLPGANAAMPPTQTGTAVAQQKLVTTNASLIAAATTAAADHKQHDAVAPAPAPAAVAQSHAHPHAHPHGHPPPHPHRRDSLAPPNADAVIPPLNAAAADHASPRLDIRPHPHASPAAAPQPSPAVAGRPPLSASAPSSPRVTVPVPTYDDLAVRPPHSSLSVCYVIHLWVPSVQKWVPRTQFPYQMQEMEYPEAMVAPMERVLHWASPFRKDVLATHVNDARMLTMAGLKLITTATGAAPVLNGSGASGTTPRLPVGVGGVCGSGSANAASSTASTPRSERIMANADEAVGVLQREYSLDLTTETEKKLNAPLLFGGAKAAYHDPAQVGWLPPLNQPPDTKYFVFNGSACALSGGNSRSILSWHPLPPGTAGTDRDPAMTSFITQSVGVTQSTAVPAAVPGASAGTFAAFNGSASSTARSNGSVSTASPVNTPPAGPAGATVVMAPPGSSGASPRINPALTYAALSLAPGMATTTMRAEALSPLLAATGYVTPVATPRVVRAAAVGAATATSPAASAAATTAPVCVPAPAADVLPAAAAVAVAAK